MNLRLKYPPTPENAAKFADDIVQLAKQVSGVTLDYSEESLQALDSIIESFRRDGAKVELISETLFSMGCYLGEVFVRNGCGSWKTLGEEEMKVFALFPLVIDAQEFLCTPIDRVFKRMENGAEESLPYFYERFASRNPKPRPWWRFW